MGSLAIPLVKILSKMFDTPKNVLLCLVRRFGRLFIQTYIEGVGSGSKASFVENGRGFVNVGDGGRLRYTESHVTTCNCIDLNFSVYLFKVYKINL